MGRPIIEKPGHRVKLQRDGQRVLRSRYEASKMLGRALLRGEVVHHKDDNPNNDSWDNLEVLASQAEHARLTHLGRDKRDIPSAVCHYCEEEFDTNPGQRRKLRADGAAKVFCSHGCYTDWRR